MGGAKLLRLPRHRIGDMEEVFNRWIKRIKKIRKMRKFKEGKHNTFKIYRTIEPERGNRILRIT